MEYLKIIGLIILFVWFGFYSFQKGRAYERGEIIPWNPKNRKK